MNGSSEYYTDGLKLMLLVTDGKGKEDRYCIGTMNSERDAEIAAILFNAGNVWDKDAIKNGVVRFQQVQPQPSVSE